MSSELPKWKSPKIVSAAKIKEIYQPQTASPDHPKGSWGLMLANDSAVVVSHEWFLKHSPKVGGYLVSYDDNYLSFSPPEPFEAGYTLIQPSTFQQRVKDEAHDLDGRRSKLGVFIDGEIYKTLPTEEQARLQRQYGAMCLYHDVLRERIEAFA